MQYIAVQVRVSHRTLNVKFFDGPFQLFERVDDPFYGHVVHDTNGVGCNWILDKQRSSKKYELKQIDTDHSFKLLKFLTILPNFSHHLWNFLNGGIFWLTDLDIIYFDI